MKIGDLVTISPHCAPPGLYGLGVVIEITHQHGGTGEPLRARVYWHGPGMPDIETRSDGGRVGCCAIRYLNKAEVK
jgi:hypothetical protein